MDRRIAALLTPIVVLSSCASAPSEAPATPASELTRLIQQSALQSCTATYRVTGPLDQTIRLTYSAPDRARFEAKGTMGGKRVEMSIWSLGSRIVALSDEGGEKCFADLTSDFGSTEELEAVNAALQRVFPFPASAPSPPEVGPGATLSLWFKPDANDPDHGEFDGNASWAPSRLAAFDWLWRTGAMPVLRLEPDRIVGEDPSTHHVVAISRSNGLIERITAEGTFCIALVEWKPSVEASAFVVPPPPTDAIDIAETYRQTIEAVRYGVMDHLIQHVALDAKRREAIPDDDFQRRLVSIFEALDRTIFSSRFAEIREGMNRETDAGLDAYARECSASANDTDLRAMCEERLKVRRTALVDGVHKRLESLLTSPTFPPSDAAAHDCEMIAEVRRRILTAKFESEVAQSVLAHFDDGVRAVREKR